jgi:chromosome segregation ATPase
MSGLGAMGAGGYLLWEQVGRLGSSLADESSERERAEGRQERRNGEFAAGLDGLRSALRTAEEANRTVADSVEALGGQVSDWHAGFEANLGRLSEEQRSVEAALTSLRQLASDQGVAIGEIEGRVSANQREIARASQQAAGQLAALAQSVDGQRVRIEELAGAHADSGEALAAAHALIAQLEQGYAAVKEELEAVRSAFGEQQTKLAELDSAVAEVRDGLALEAAFASPEPAEVAQAPEAAVPEAPVGLAAVTDDEGSVTTSQPDVGTPGLEVFSAGTSGGGFDE